MTTATNQRPISSLADPGRFVVGCNYWASHAGTAMWTDWRPDVVEEDLRQLAGAGLTVLRVFPLWSEFQPVRRLRGAGGGPGECRLGEEPLPDSGSERMGLSEQALDRFAFLADAAERHHLSLIVALLTGWMSHRTFVPPALEGLNVITDPFAIEWEVRFIRGFVRRFKPHAAIVAWEPGNECNCMGKAGSREAAWLWTWTIAQAIRAEDPSRLVLSGMHSLGPTSSAEWRIQDQGELTDMLTTHPYPLFTAHCNLDPVQTMRPVLHGAAETRFYADIGGKPCLVEETGTMGPLLANDDTSIAFARAALFSAWAHDGHGFLWWCAYDQSHLSHAPYDWDPTERELGLIRPDRTAKPVLGELTAFGAFLAGLPFDRLPPRVTEAVCIVSNWQDAWGAGQSAFLMAKQAGFDIEFQYVDQPLRPADLYLLPSPITMTRRAWLALLERVAAGSTLYVSCSEGFLSPFNEPFGVEVIGREKRAAPSVATLDGLPGAPRVSLGSPVRLMLRAVRADILGREENGNPVLTRAAYGRGTIYFFAASIETDLCTVPGVFHTPEAVPFWRLYRHIGEPFLLGRAVAKSDPMIGVTEHPFDDRRRVVVAANYRTEPAEIALTVNPGWSVREWYRGRSTHEGGSVLIPGNDAVVFCVERNP